MSRCLGPGYLHVRKPRRKDLESELARLLPDALQETACKRAEMAAARKVVPGTIALRTLGAAPSFYT